MSTLSVVMIVKDEAACLAQCLEGICGIADAIILGDTGSSDDTAEIARGFGANVFAVPWRDDFAEARNHVLDRARGDWLLHLDADEVVDPENAARIRAVADADGTGADAIEVTLANYSDDMRAWRWRPAKPGDPWARGHAGYVAVGLLRLFRNGRGFEYREAVHENITESVVERGGIIRAEPILIHHYGYAATAGSGRDKCRRYYEMAREKIRNRPDDPKAWHDLAEQALSCGDASEAERAAREALRIAPLDVSVVTTLANLLLNRGDLDEARALFEALERAGIAPPHVVMTLGAVALKQGRVQEAFDRLEAVVAAYPEQIQARLYLARALDALGRVTDAAQQLAIARATAPSLDELDARGEAHRLRREGEARFRSGDAAGALAILVNALRRDPEDPVIHNDIGVVLANLGEHAKARESFERALRLSPALCQAQDNLAER